MDFYKGAVKKLGCELNISLHMPQLFVNEEEYKEYILINGQNCNLRCLKNTQVWIEEGRYRVTHCPILREVRKFDYDLKRNDKSIIDYTVEGDGYCPASAACVGPYNCEESIDGKGNLYMIDNEIYHTICRFDDYNYKRPIKYEY